MLSTGFRYLANARHHCLSFLQVVLETEATNTAALRLYEKLGFVRDKRLPKYYLNGNDAFRLWYKLKP